MGSQDGAVTTGLLDATHYIKDNRLLPEGFDRATASADVAVHGEALADPDFIGGADRVLFNVALGSAQGPFEITAQLFYQPIGYRWAMNLAGYEAPEPQRFVAYYVSAAQGSAALVASDVAIGKAVVP